MSELWRSGPGRWRRLALAGDPASMVPTPSAFRHLRKYHGPALLGVGWINRITSHRAMPWVTFEEDPDRPVRLTASVISSADFAPGSSPPDVGEQHWLFDRSLQMGRHMSPRDAVANRRRAGTHLGETLGRFRFQRTDTVRSRLNRRLSQWLPTCALAMICSTTDDLALA